MPRDKDAKDNNNNNKKINISPSFIIQRGLQAKEKPKHQLIDAEMLRTDIHRKEQVIHCRDVSRVHPGGKPCSTQRANISY